MADEKKPETGKSQAGPLPEKPKKIKAPLKKRLIRIGIIVLAVLIVQALVRDALIKTAVEKAGTFLVGTKVELGSFHSSVFGRVRIKKLTVANPPGYKNPFAFMLGEARVGINIFSLLSKKIIVREIFVEGMNVDYELKLGGSNLGDIQKNLSRFASKNDPEDEDTPASDEPPPKQVVIRDLRITDNWLSFSNSTLGTTLKLPLPGMHLENLGDGKPIGETVNELYNAIFAAVGNSIADAGSAVGDAAGNAGGAIGKAAKDVGNAVKSLFK